jgi:hypothetical protein
MLLSNMFKIIILITVLMLPLRFSLAQSTQLNNSNDNPQSGNIGDGIDCTNISIDFQDDPTLTTEERIALMDQAFFQSINKYDLCRNLANTNGGGGSSGASGDAGNPAGGTNGQDSAENADGQGKANTGKTTANADGLTGTETARQADPSNQGFKGKSNATSELTGTQAPRKPPTATDIVNEDGRMSPAEGGNGNMNDQSNDQGGIASGSKIPEDIPTANNDDALAAQIRYAAVNEKNPAKPKLLWAEYRKYKGLPPK